MGKTGGSLTEIRVGRQLIKLKASIPSVTALLLLAAVLLPLAAPAHSAGDGPAKTPAQRGQRKLLLFAKNPANWSVVKGGGRGQLNYRESTGAYALEATGLQPRSSYALIRYCDAPPKGEVLGRGTSDERGRLELRGVWHNWSNKFWLVSGEDVAGSAGASAVLRAWQPDRYLFEEKPLDIPCACPEPEEE